jgi:aminocarboxymuconate-semialdehyde decarboxylase
MFGMVTVRYIGPHPSWALVQDEHGGVGGRPVDGTYWDVKQKLANMDANGIDTSVMSLANPWLDFLDAPEATTLATELNRCLTSNTFLLSSNTSTPHLHYTLGARATVPYSHDIPRPLPHRDMESMCTEAAGRIYGFGVLPLQDSRACVAEIERLSTLDHMRGVIVGTSGAGKGLDDPALDPVWAALKTHDMMTFIHPHYGVGNEHFGGFGHSLYLSLGFTFETTVAVSRMVCMYTAHDCTAQLQYTTLQYCGYGTLRCASLDYAKTKEMTAVCHTALLHTR